MPVTDLRRRFRAHLEELEQANADRFVDLAVAWERKKTGEQLGYFGGRWDSVEKRFTTDKPERCIVVQFNESQVELAQNAAWWIQERAMDRPRPFINLFALGDRGGGKTYATVAILGTLQIEFPQLGSDSSIAWAVSRSHADRAEIDRTFQSIFPAGWYVYREWPHHAYKWITGAQLFNASADSVEGLRAKGRVDFLLINEAGIVGKQVPFNSVPRIKDRGGLALYTANPPQQTKGEWILDLHEKAEAAKELGRDYHTKFVRVLSAGNTNLDKAVADQVASFLYDLDPKAAKADVEGLLLPIGDRAYFRFRKNLHLHPEPLGGDITRAFTLSRLGREYDYIGGADFQAKPHNAAVICKVYGSLYDPILWVVDDFLVGPGTEDDLLNEIDDAGYTPDNLVWVGDASGQWQDGKHNTNGRDSFKVFQSRRWHIVPPAAKKTDKGNWSKNPPIEKRVSLVNRFLGDPAVNAPVRLVLDPGTEETPKCRRIAEALRECPWVKARFGGKPNGPYAHVTDALGYVVWWVCPSPDRPRINEPLADFAPARDPTFFY